MTISIGFNLERRSRIARRKSCLGGEIVNFNSRRQHETRTQESGVAGVQEFED
jgi:hypothetical protein